MYESRHMFKNCFWRGWSRCPRFLSDFLILLFLHVWLGRRGCTSKDRTPRYGLPALMGWLAFLATLHAAVVIVMLFLLCFAILWKIKLSLSSWKSQSELLQTEINGESTSTVWPTLGSRTAKEQNRRVERNYTEMIFIYFVRRWQPGKPAKYRYWNDTILLSWQPLQQRDRRH